MNQYQATVAQVAELIKNGSVKYSTKHIEIDRKYREIEVNDVREVLKNGKVTNVGMGGYVEWVGKDIEGREIKLLCRLQDRDDNPTSDLTIVEALSVRTAYQPSLDDDKLREEWLKTNTDWQVNSKGYVEKKNGKKI